MSRGASEQHHRHVGLRARPLRAPPLPAAAARLQVRIKVTAPWMEGAEARVIWDRDKI